MKKSERHGHTMVELLVVMAIIGVLSSMLLAALSKARLKALQVASTEAVRQHYIGEYADKANIARPEPDEPDLARLRQACKSAYREKYPTGSGETIVTRLLYVVRTEAEFRAYWHTLVNPEATRPLELESGALVVYDERGNKFELAPLDLGRVKGESFPVGWEFLSTDMSEMSSGSIGANVLYSDGHVEYVPYPGKYPVCKTVADLSHRFVQGR